MADDTEAGLSVRQLLKLVASGHLSPDDFKRFTKHVLGCDEEVPIDVTGDDQPDAEHEAPAQGTAAPTSPAAVANTPAPAAPEAGGAQNGEDEDEDGGSDDDDDDAEEAAAAALSGDEAEAGCWRLTNRLVLPSCARRRH